MGYGARALQALNSFYSGEYFNLDEGPAPEPSYPDPAAIDEVCLLIESSHYSATTYQFFSSQSTNLLTDRPTIRAATAMPPLLQRLTERRPETLDYLGVSYGLTPQLLRYAFDGIRVVLPLSVCKVLEARGLCSAVHPADDERAHGRAHLRDGAWAKQFRRGRARVARRVRERYVPVPPRFRLPCL